MRLLFIALLLLAPQASRPIFDDVAAETGLNFRHHNGMTDKFYLPEIMGAGGALFDYDGDDDLDVFLVQGAELGSTKPNGTLPQGKLFRNDFEGRKLQFTDVTQKSRIRATGYGMGVAVGDINNDGRPDLYVTNLGSNQMFLNKGDGTFDDVTKSSATDDS